MWKRSLVDCYFEPNKSIFGPAKIIPVERISKEKINICDICSEKVACDSCENFIWDVFDINYHTWKHLRW